MREVLFVLGFGGGLIRKFFIWGKSNVIWREGVKVGSRRVFVSLVVMLFLFLSLLGSQPAVFASAQEVSSVSGPPLDSVEISAVDDVLDGIYGVANGTFDVLLYPSLWQVYSDLPQEVLENITLIRASSQFRDLLFNPVQNFYYDNETGSFLTLLNATASLNSSNLTLLPGLVNTTGGEIHFNPFALRKVRYAMNWLISRDYVVENILFGSGASMYSSVQPSEPSSKYFRDLYSLMNLSKEGDVVRAVEMIEEAMINANETLSKFGYYLFKRVNDTSPAGYWWTLHKPDGQEEFISVRFYIRVEDERHEMGLYIADLIEKYAGIRVDRRVEDVGTCIWATYFTNPVDYVWNIYTEGWTSMVISLYPELKITLMYAPWFGFMPGFQATGWWQYVNDTIDDVTLKVCRGVIVNETEFWNSLREAVKLGMQESVRVFISEIWCFFPVSQRVSKVVGDVTSGLWSRWTLRTADTVDHKLRVAWLSGLPWWVLNPITGPRTAYPSWMLGVVSDFGDYPHPKTGKFVSVRYYWDEPIEKDYVVDDQGNLVRKLVVDQDAVIYDSFNDTWVQVGNGVNATTKVVYHFNWSNWHHGQPMTMEDIRKVIGLIYEWSTQDYDGDPTYNSHYASRMRRYLDAIKGFKFLNENTLVVWLDYVHFDDGVIADYVGRLIWAEVPWEIYTAMEYLAVYGGQSGTIYYIDTIDLLNASHVQDLKAALNKFINESYVPPEIAGYVSWEEAQARYEAAISWIDNYTYALISNGPFYLESYDSDTRSALLRAFRDLTYPFAPEDFYEMTSIPPGESAVTAETHTPIFNSGVVSLGNVSLSLNTTETQLVSVYEFSGDPILPAKFNSVGYFDIIVSNTSAVEWPIYVESLYTDEEVAELGLNESLLAVYFYNSSKGDYQRCSSTGVDVENNIIWAYISEEEYKASGILIAFTAPLETVPPETTISLSGTLGFEGWYVSDVIVTLTVSDDTSGVAETMYSFDGVTWFTYTEPFTITSEGITTVYYYSTDNVGNVEETKVETIKIDKTPPTTDLTIGVHYVDENGNIYVTSATEFTLTASDSVSGVAYTYYRINGSDWVEYIDAFNLTGPDGTYVIEYYSVDVAGNGETIRSVTVILVSFEVNSYMTDSDFNPITYFDVVFAKDGSSGYKLVATNPGQFYYNIEIVNNWPIVVNMTIDVYIPEDFVLKGAVPIHIYLDGSDITDLCLISGTTITVMDVSPRSIVYVTIHLDYGLKGTIYASLDEFELKGYVFSVVVSGSGGSPSVPGEGLVGAYSSSATLIAHQKKTTAIAGFVMDVDGNPIVGVTVKLFDSSGNLVAETVTDENGFYYFVDIEAGDYIVQVTYNGQTYAQETSVAKDELAQVDFEIE